jgi:hypothetical protein
LEGITFLPLASRASSALFMAWESYRAKALCFGTDTGNSRGCRFPLEDIVEVLYLVLGENPCPFGLDGGDTLHVTLPGVLSWSLGVQVHDVVC